MIDTREIPAGNGGDLLVFPLLGPPHHAGFNIYAASDLGAVFRADCDVTMVGLNLTHQALATLELQNRVER